jgi:tetratricopeptide (TPR) repeat protein
MEIVPVRPNPSGRRRWAWIAGLTVFGVAAGWLLALSAGERGVNGQITGSIELSPREQVLECQTMGAQGQLLDSFECFDEVLQRDPQNAQALAYRGWYGVLASGSAQDVGQDDIAAELLAAGGLNLDRAVEADPTYPDARAFRMIVFERLGRVDEACEDAVALQELRPPEQILQLTAPVIERLGC